jgi:hypothetical protein
MAPTPEHRSPSPLSEGDVFASEVDAYHALCAYTLQLRDPAFLHQYVVDAWTVKNADTNTKAIALIFAMFGLYLAVEKGISGRQVQRFHIRMAKRHRSWPSLPLRQGSPSVTVVEVMQAPSGSKRDALILAFAAAAWKCCTAARPAIIEIAHTECGIAP